MGTITLDRALLVLGGVALIFVRHILSSSVYFSGLNEAQQFSVVELNRLVNNPVTDRHQLDDWQIFNYLKKTNFNAAEAWNLIQETLQWRSKEGIDNILSEDWTEMSDRFPYSLNTVDKYSRPILYFDIAQWDIASELANGDDSKMSRYMVKIHEDSVAKVKTFRNQGLNVTQFKVIVNTGDWSLAKHVCTQCMYFYRNIGQLLAANYPMVSHKVYFLNTPFLMKMSYAFLSPSNQKTINIYGQNEEEWKKALLEDINLDQFPVGLIDATQQLQNHKDNSEGFMDWKQEL